MPKQISHIPRTLRRCRKDLRWHAGKVEQWVGFKGNKGGRTGGLGGVRVDLFNGIDIIALDGQPGSLGIQVCGETGISPHKKKLRELVSQWEGYTSEGLLQDEEHPLLEWLRAGNRLEIWSWRQRPKKPGGRWECRVVPLEEKDLRAAAGATPG